MLSPSVQIYISPSVRYYTNSSLATLVALLRLSQEALWHAHEAVD